MKKNRIRLNKTTCAMLLSCTLVATSLTGCMKEASGIECEESFSVMNSLPERLNSNIEESLKTVIETRISDFDVFVQRLSEKGNVDVIYQKESLTISGKGEDLYSEKLSDDFYYRLNLLIREGDIKGLSFRNLKDSFDFSKVNFTNIKSLSFANCSGVVDCSNALQEYDEIRFSNTSWEIATEILESCNVSKANVYWGEAVEHTGELKSLLEFLVEKNIPMGTFCVSQSNKNNYDGITEEEFQLLSQVNTTLLQVGVEGFQKPISFDLTLHDNIRSFYMSTYNIYGELGSIKINSNNDIYCSFSGFDVTENTSFSLPDSAWVSLQSLDCENIAAFYDLANIYYLSFEGEYDSESEIEYCSNPEGFIYNENIYRNYDEVLEELENRYGKGKGQR